MYKFSYVLAFIIYKWDYVHEILVQLNILEDYFK